MTSGFAALLLFKDYFLALAAEQWPSDAFAVTHQTVLVSINSSSGRRIRNISSSHGLLVSVKNHDIIRFDAVGQQLAGSVCHDGGR